MGVCKVASLVVLCCVLVLKGAAASPAQPLYDDDVFLRKMIDHHQAAVDMAGGILRDGDDPQIRTWATDIIGDQTREIGIMRELLESSEDPNGRKHPSRASHAMDMPESAIKGCPKDDLFLKSMIPHHAGAIDMSVPALTQSKNMKIVALAENIIEQKTREIVAFRKWLETRSHCR